MATNLKLLYQNVRGLRTKTLQFYRSVLETDLDIILVTESWLHSGILDSELCDTRYEVFRKDRLTTTTGGGVLICIKKSLAARVRPEWSRPPSEFLWVTVPQQSLRGLPSDLHICVSYIVGGGSDQAAHVYSFIDSIEQVTSSYPRDLILAAGDFNLPCIKWSPSCTTVEHEGLAETQLAASKLVSDCGMFALSQNNFFHNSSGNIVTLLS